MNIEIILENINKTELLLTTIKSDLKTIKQSNNNTKQSLVNLVYTDVLKFIDQTKAQLINQANVFYDESKNLFNTAFEDFHRKMDFELKQYNFNNKTPHKTPISNSKSNYSFSYSPSDPKTVSNLHEQTEKINPSGIIDIFNKSESEMTYQQYSDYFIYENESNLYFGLGKHNGVRDGKIYYISKNENNSICRCKVIGDSLQNLDGYSWDVNEKKLYIYGGYYTDLNNQPNHTLFMFDGRYIKKLDTQVNIPPMYKCKIQVNRQYSSKLKDYIEFMYLFGGKSKLEWKNKKLEQESYENNICYPNSMYCYNIKNRHVNKYNINILGRSRHLFYHMNKGTYIIGLGKRFNEIFNDIYIYKSSLNYLVKYEVDNLPPTCSISCCKDKNYIIIYGGIEGFIASLRYDTYTELKWKSGWKFRSKNGSIASYQGKVYAFKDYLNENIREIEYEKELKGIQGENGLSFL